MKNISLIIIMTAVVALSSCAKNDIGEELSPMTAQSDIAALMLDGVDSTAAYEHYLLRLDAKADGDYRLSDEEITESLLRFCNPDSHAKTADVSEQPALTIKGIRPLNEPVALRSANDPRAAVPPVVVEFTSEQGDGYAVCSGDVRYQKIFSYVPSGSLDDTVNIKMLSLFYRSVSHSINDSIARFNSRVGTLQALNLEAEGTSITPRLHPNHPDHNKIPLPDGMFCLGEEYIINTDKESYLGMKIKWDQNAPYNNAMPHKNELSNCYPDNTNNRAVVGCVPIAAGQAIAYKKYKYFKNIAPHWDAINNYSSIKGSQYEDVVAKFLREIADGVKVSYTSKGTAAFPEDLDIYLKELNRKDASVKHEYYNGNVIFMPDSIYRRFLLVYNAISKKNPVIISVSDISAKVGHSFVVDGAKYYSGTLYEVLGTEYDGVVNKMYRHLSSDERLYISCNWGWGGKSDGLYDYYNLNPGIYEFNTWKGIFILK
ncbi:MAG: C10 family peptidase [Rikenellaceae bacterium]|nr:C10 family peptidase [Rikenellaceae bacterium]